ncbi:MAG TPA: hypothetical protein VMW68_06630 [Methyloceanibacter sp.]|nr:hypothetical protein [Methyloceanibacter sp.]
MLLRTLRILPLAAASMLAALAFTDMASAEQAEINLGPVGPYQPIVATVGDKRIIAYYAPDGGKCAVSAVVFDTADRGQTPARIRVALHPGELFHLDSVVDQTVVMTCGPNAEMITVLNRGELLTKAARVN